MRIAEKEVGPPVGSGTSCPRDVGVARERERQKPLRYVLSVSSEI